MKTMKGTHKASKFAAEGIISSMPDDVVTNILGRLPLQDAVRTSVLSRNWRFKWTMLGQLVFDKNFYKYLLELVGEYKYERIISRLLLHFKGVVTKFVLYIEERNYYELDDDDIEHWILFLSRQGIKDLTVCKGDGEILYLPTQLFSCLELTHLKLENCHLDPLTSFHGFPNLLSLELHDVLFENEGYVKFFTRCPALTHLKMLSSSFSYLNEKMVKSPSIIFKLFRILPNLQELHLELWCEFIEDGAIKRSPTTFPCLKTLKLFEIDLENGIQLSCVFEMIRSFPNLQTLEITPSCNCKDDIPSTAVCSLDVDYNTMGLLQLRNVVFTYTTASESEICLIKYLLACSPFLEKIVIHPHDCLALGKQLMFSRKLLKLHRASPYVDINLC